MTFYQYDNKPQGEGVSFPEGLEAIDKTLEEKLANLKPVDVEGILAPEKKVIATIDLETILQDNEENIKSHIKKMMADKVAKEIEEFVLNGFIADEVGGVDIEKALEEQWQLEEKGHEIMANEGKPAWDFPPKPDKPLGTYEGTGTLEIVGSGLPPQEGVNFKIAVDEAVGQDKHVIKVVEWPKLTGKATKKAKLNKQISNVPMVKGEKLNPEQLAELKAKVNKMDFEVFDKDEVAYVLVEEFSNEFLQKWDAMASDMRTTLLKRMDAMMKGVLPGDPYTKAHFIAEGLFNAYTGGIWDDTPKEERAKMVEWVVKFLAGEKTKKEKAMMEKMEGTNEKEKDVAAPEHPKHLTTKSYSTSGPQVSMLKGGLFECEKDIFSHTYNVYGMAHDQVDMNDAWMVQPVSLEKFKKNSSIKHTPFLSLDPLGAAELMNALWHAGLRPEGWENVNTKANEAVVEGLKAELAAVKTHLEDMRVIAKEFVSLKK